MSEIISNGNISEKIVHELSKKYNVKTGIIYINPVIEAVQREVKFTNEFSKDGIDVYRNNHGKLLYNFYYHSKTGRAEYYLIKIIL